MAATYVPIHLFLAVTDVVTPLGGKTFGGIMGAIYLNNTGANDCWITLDSVAPMASDGDGRTRLLASGRGVSLEIITATELRAICAAGLTAGIQIIVLPRPGGSSFGMT